MPVPGDSLVLLLPEARRFAGQPLSAEFSWRLGRADRLPGAEAGERAQLLRYFDLQPRGWPMAAITRQADCADARDNAWLRADPAHVRADMGSVRLLACGDLGLSPDECELFLKPLRPLFGDVGFPISAATPSRWYLMLPREAKIPTFPTPTEAIGDDVFAHVPEGPEGKRWRAMLNEVQIVLHNHPRNQQRISAGQLPVNSLWFWGGGVLPDHIRCSAQSVESDEFELQALSRLAGISAVTTHAGNRIVDCRGERDWSNLESRQIEQWLRQLGTRFAQLVMDFADGTRFVIEPRQRWRWFRRPIGKLA